MQKISLPIALLCFFALLASCIDKAGAGGLSQNVARRAMCEDRLAQCWAKIREDFKCKDEDAAACRDQRYLPEKKCNYIYKNCMSDMPVKSIRPVSDKKKRN
jgi:hypothetical protein